MEKAEYLGNEGCPQRVLCGKLSAAAEIRLSAA